MQSHPHCHATPTPHPLPNQVPNLDSPRRYGLQASCAILAAPCHFQSPLPTAIPQPLPHAPRTSCFMHSPCSAFPFPLLSPTPAPFLISHSRPMLHGCQVPCTVPAAHSPSHSQRPLPARGTLPENHPCPEPSVAAASKWRLCPSTAASPQPAPRPMATCACPSAPAITSDPNVSPSSPLS